MSPKRSSFTLLRTQFWQGTSLAFEPVTTQTILTDHLSLSFFSGSCFCPFINKHFISGFQAGLVSFSRGQGDSGPLSGSVSGLWPYSLSHFEIRLPQAVHYLHETVRQFPQPLLPPTQKLVPLWKGHGNHSKVLGGISGQNSVEGQDVNEAENTHTIKPLPFSHAAWVATRMPK